MAGKKIASRAGTAAFPKGSPELEAKWYLSGGRMEIVGLRNPKGGAISMKAFAGVFNEVERIAGENGAKRIVIDTWLPEGIISRYGFKKSRFYPYDLVPKAVQKPLMRLFGYGPPKGKKRWKNVSMKRFVKKMPK